MKKSTIKYRTILFTLGMIGLFSACAYADSAAQSDTNTIAAEAQTARFSIVRYVIDGSSVLSQAEIDAATAHFVGDGKSFNDVQQALAAVTEAVSAHGLQATKVSLPEQKLQNGIVHFQVTEIHFGKIMVHENHYFSESNILSSLPSLKAGNIPKPETITAELKLANENPSKQADVTLKQGNQPNTVDADVHVRDARSSMYNVFVDNTGSAETGNTRLGLLYRNANVFDADHVATLQYLISPEHTNRVQVIGGSYKIPLYDYGDSMDFFAGYSNVNSLVGGLSNFQGGGRLVSVRYNHTLDKLGMFEQKISLGVDWRYFRRVEQTQPLPILLYNEIVVTPVNLSYTADGKFENSELNFNTTISSNLPSVNRGNSFSFNSYDPSRTLKPRADYFILRYGLVFSRAIAQEWLIKTILNGQQSRDALILGEQFRLGGADAVRGFSEGSESGDSGTRFSLEGYTPNLVKNNIVTRGVAFFDVGQIQSSTVASKLSIASAGFGLRANFGTQVNAKLDVANILKAGTDPLQRAGKWRAHVSVSASF